jgi:hypothetical protein
MATAVLEELALVGNPWNNPERRLAAPSALISALGSTRRPDLSAVAVERAPVSANETRATARAPAVRVPMRLASMPGKVREGRPEGRGPTLATARSKRITRTMETNAATSTPGLPGRRKRMAWMMITLTSETRRAWTTVWPSSTAVNVAVSVSTVVSASTENPSALGSCDAKTTTAMPFR